MKLYDYEEIRIRNFENQINSLTFKVRYLEDVLGRIELRMINILDLLIDINALLEDTVNGGKE
jgi:hypothetical protein